MKDGKSSTIAELLANLEDREAEKIIERAKTELYLSERMIRSLKKRLEGPPGKIKHMYKILDEWVTPQESETLHDALKDIFSPVTMYLNQTRTRNT